MALLPPFLLSAQAKRDANKSDLRPHLASPNFVDELDALRMREASRASQVGALLSATHSDVRVALTTHGAGFLARLVTCSENIFLLLDNTVMPSDLRKLPGDELVLPPRPSIKTLYKMQGRAGSAAAGGAGGAGGGVAGEGGEGGGGEALRRFPVKTFNGLLLEGLGLTEAQIAKAALEAEAKAGGEGGEGKDAAAAEEKAGKGKGKGKDKGKGGKGAKDDAANGGGDGDGEGGEGGAGVHASERIACFFTHESRAALRARDEAYAQYNGFLCDALGQCDDKYSGMAGELESWTADFGRQVAMLVAQEEA